MDSKQCRYKISHHTRYIIDLQYIPALLTFFVVYEVCVRDVEDEAGEAGLVAPEFLQDDPAALPLVTAPLASDGVLRNADVGPHPLLEPDAVPPHWELTACTVEMRIMVQLIANLYKENFRPPTTNTT